MGRASLYKMEHPARMSEGKGLLAVFQSRRTAHATDDPLWSHRARCFVSPTKHRPRNVDEDEHIHFGQVPALAVPCGNSLISFDIAF